MQAKTVRVTERDIVEEYEEENKKVVEKIRNVIGINPRTKVVGLNSVFSNTFSVDIATGKIYVVPVKTNDIARGYLTHENGHRAVFPASSAGSIAFISSVKARVPHASNEEVVAAANIVADAFSDYVLFRAGLGKELVKRIPDFTEKAEPVDLGMTFKLIIYKAIELAEKKKNNKVTNKELSSAAMWLIKKKQTDVNLVKVAVMLASNFIRNTNELLNYSTPKEIAEFLLNPFTARNAPTLDFLSEIATILLIRNEDMDMPLSGSMSGCSGSSGGRSSTGQRTKKPERSGEKDEKKPLGTGEKKSEERGVVEGVDIKPSKIDVTDIQIAIEIASRGFGLYGNSAGIAIEAVFSKELREAVKKLLDKLKLTFAQNDYKVYRPSGFQKKKSLLWLRPRGEPDEDSVLMETRKLLWTVTYHVPSPRGKLSVAPATVPEKLVIILDESGSTTAPFGRTNVVSAEAFVSMVVEAGLRYKKGAKQIDVIKFSDSSLVVYSGSDEVEAGVKTLIPSPIGGGGTNIIQATRYGLKRATKNTAIVLVTDAVIDNFTAETLGKLLRFAADRKIAGFIVVIVINPEKVPSIDIIRKHLTGRNSIVEHVRSPDDLIQVSNNIMSHILKTYSTTK